VTPAGSRKRLSIVVPMHNEAGCIDRLHEEVDRALGPLPYELEFVFVDDGSRDDTIERVKAIRAKDPRVKWISFSKNYGHQIALTAGMRAATGDAVITMDADLQHPPALLPALVGKWEEGNKIVETVKKGKRGAGPLKRWFAAHFYGFFNRVSKTKLIPGASDFRLLDRMCVDAVNAHPERHRFLRGLVQSIGFQCAIVEFEPAERFAGEPGYTFMKSLTLAVNGLFTFSNLPLQAAFFAGVAILALLVVYLIVSTVLYFTTKLVAPGWTSTIAAIALMGGLNLLCLGVLSVYVSKIYEEVRHRPIFIVEETGGVDAEALK
jgi:glycosyltransferase involved in cell wall biosynthesis